MQKPTRAGTAPVQRPAIGVNSAASGNAAFVTPRHAAICVPMYPLPAQRWTGPTNGDLFLTVQETAAVLRAELRRQVPDLKCSVRVEHEVHGRIRVRTKAQRNHDVEAHLYGLIVNLTLLRFDSEVTDDLWNHQVMLRQGGMPVRVTNNVRSIRVEHGAQ